jgi:hypothetical protein
MIGEEVLAEEEDDSNSTVAWWRHRKTKGRKRRRKNSIPVRLQLCDEYMVSLSWTDHVR